MELVELFVQGLKGASELTRVPFGPAVTMLPGTARERLYVRVMIDLLYPKGTEPTLFDLDVPNAQSRVGLTVRGRDGTTFRLLQDVHTGRRALQRVVGDKAEAITNAANEIAQAVTAQVGFPQEDVLRELMFAVKEDLPSQQTSKAAAPSGKPVAAAGGSAKVEKPLPPGFGDVAPAARADKPLPPGFSDGPGPASGPHDEAALRRRLEEVNEALAGQQGTRDVEFEIDGIQKRLFELESKLKPLLTLRRSVQQAEDQLKGFAGLASVPGDLVEKGEQLQRARAEHDAEIDRMTVERDALIDSSATLDRSGKQNAVAVAQKDVFVRVGVGVGVGAILLGVVGALSYPPLQWLAFLDIPGFGVALFGGMRVLASLEGGARTRKRIERLDKERKRLEEKFKIDESAIKAILDKHGYKVEQLPDLAQQLVARDEAQRVHAQTSAALKDAERGGDVQSLEGEQKELQTRLRSLEEKLQLNGGFGGGADLEREKAEIEAALRGGPNLAPPAAVDAEEPAIADLSPSSRTSRALTPAPDLGRRQIELARDVMLMSIEDTAIAVQPRASQILAALSDGRYKELRFAGDLETQVVDAAGGEELPFGYLPPLDRDTVWLSLKIACVEAAVRKQRTPVVFDRALDVFPDAKGQLLARMLGFLAGSTQVVCITEKQSIR